VCTYIHLVGLKSMALGIWANGAAAKPRGFMKQTPKPAGLIRG